MSRTYGKAQDLIDFTRASSATYLDSDGLLKTASNNIPRIEYDANGNLLGLLVEESRTNTITSSNDATVLDTLGGASTVATNSTEVQSPTGSGTVIKLDKTGSTYGFARILFSGASTSVVFSVYAKKGTARYVGLRTLGSPNSTHTAFDFDTETFTQTTGSAARGYEKLPNGWYRLWIYNAAATNSAEWASAAIVNSNGDESNTETGTLYLFGYQREINVTFPTSYIPTSGSTATRSADVASLSTSAFGYRQDEGSVVVEFELQENWTSTINSRLFNLSNSNNERLSFVANTGTDDFFIFSLASGISSSLSPVVNTNSSGQSQKIAGVFAKDGYALTFDGNTVTTSASVSLPDAATDLHIGSFYTGAAYINGHIKSIKYYPRRLTNDQLVEVTS